MEVVAQDENAVGAAGRTFGNTQRQSARSGSGWSGVPLGKAATSTKTPGRKAFRNITNLSVQRPQLPGKALEVKKPRKAFGNITNAAPAQLDVQPAVLSKEPVSAPVATAQPVRSARPQQIFDGEVEHLAGMSWLEQEQERLTARHALLDQGDITSIIAPFVARHLPAEDLSLMEWKRRQDRLGRATLEEVPLCPYVDPPSSEAWLEGSESEPATGDARFAMPAVDYSVLCS